MSYAVTHDEHSDVLYVLEEGSKVHRSIVAKDGYLVINRDGRARAVGLQILFVSDMTAEAWRQHPDRDLIPAELHAEVESWIDNHLEHLA